MSLFQIKRQIDSIRKTRQITNAMRLVSTSKYNKMGLEAKNYDLYASLVRKLVFNVISPNVPRLAMTDLGSGVGFSPIDYHEMLVERPVLKTGYLVVTSDKGLAGDYNSTLLKRLDAYLKEHHDNFDDIEILAIGDPIIKFCRQKGLHVAYETHNISDYPTYTEVQQVIQKAIGFFNEKVYDSLKVVYNHSENIMTTKPRIETMLPLVSIDYGDEEIEAIDYLIEPSPDIVLDDLLIKYTESQIYGAIIDAKTSEQASRMQAMNQATKNADDLINKLQKQYNQQRQLRITNEILDIINGSMAQQE